MSKNQKKGASREAYYARYKANKVREINRLMRIERAIKRNPENEQLKLHLKDVGKPRATPKTKVWNPTTIRIAQLMKEFTGVWDKNILSPDVKLWAVAKNTRNEQLFKQVPKLEHVKGMNMFSLGMRI